MLIRLFIGSLNIDFHFHEYYYIQGYYDTIILHDVKMLDKLPD